MFGLKELYYIYNMNAYKKKKDMDALIRKCKQYSKDNSHKKKNQKKRVHLILKLEH